MPGKASVVVTFVGNLTHNEMGEIVISAYYYLGCRIIEMRKLLERNALEEMKCQHRAWREGR